MAGKPPAASSAPALTHIVGRLRGVDW